MGQIGGSNRMLNMVEASAFLGVPHATLADKWKTWEMPAYRVGKRLVFRERDLESWLQSHRA